MKIIIFEGIASSGKTTIERLLAKALPNSKIVTEGDTLMPLIDNRSPEVAINHLQTLLSSLRKETADNLIVDRFHLTHAFRTHSTLSEFLSIENGLNALGQTLIVLLTMNESSIKVRIEETMKHRQDSWKKGAQGTLEEKAAYYAEQQRQLLRLRQETTLPSLVLDTTDKNWTGCVARIKQLIQS